MFDIRIWKGVSPPSQVSFDPETSGEGLGVVHIHCKEFKIKKLEPDFFSEPPLHASWRILLGKSPPCAARNPLGKKEVTFHIQILTFISNSHYNR